MAIVLCCGLSSRETATLQAIRNVHTTHFVLPRLSIAWDKDCFYAFKNVPDIQALCKVSENKKQLECSFRKLFGRFSGPKYAGDLKNFRGRNCLF